VKYYKFIFILIILFLTSCATKTTFQVDGMPIQDNFVRAKTFNLGLIVKYQMTQYFNVKEGDESYESYEYLPLTNPQIHKIDNPTKMEININVFNENKESYKIIKYITKEGGDLQAEVVYDGNLSRNNLTLQLPLEKNKLINFYLDINDKKDNLELRTFKAQYIIEG